MLIIADYRLSTPMRYNLQQLGSPAWVRNDQVYEAISGHPDIFLCATTKALIIAPNAPDDIFMALTQWNIAYIVGTTPINKNYPETARYNAVAANGLLIHNLKITDPTVLQETINMRQIHVNQGYTRCNLLPLPDGSFITSDAGIHQALKINGVESIFIDPTGIVLHGFNHGFIGGTAGWHNNRLIFAGNPDHPVHHPELINTLNKKGIEWQPLSDEPLIDAGGLFFL